MADAHMSPSLPGRSGLRWGEVAALTRARVVLFWREPEVCFWVLIFPLALALILGWAFAERGSSPENVGVGPGPEADAIASRLDAEELLQVRRFDSAEEAERALSFGRVSALVEPGSPPTVRFDPERPEAELTRFRVEAALRESPAEGTPAAVAVESTENTGVRYIDWLFPGLLGMNILGTGIWGIGFGLTDTRQRKLLRRFLVTPMRRSSFLLSFMLFRMVFLVIEVAVLVLFAIFVLGIPQRGSFLLLGGLLLIGATAFYGLGVLVASRARTVEGASGLMNFVMMPMWLFSGVFFSYERFPEVVHPLIQALPLTALNDALRATMLEGAGVTAVLPAALVLVAWGAGSFFLALRIFRWE